MLSLYGLIAIQIVTESFPISSSGHVVLWQRLWTLLLPELAWNNATCGLLAQEDFLETIIHFAHIPTICALVFVFFDRLKLYTRAISARTVGVSGALFFIALADGITVLFYLFFKEFVIFTIPLASGFFVTACLLFSLRWCAVANRQFSLWLRACLLGCVQGVSLLPGISRLGAIFVTARWLGLKPLEALEISWILQIPLIGAALVKSTIILYKQQDVAFFSLPYIWLVALSAGVVATFGLLLFRKMVEHNHVWMISLYVLVISITAALVAC